MFLAIDVGNTQSTLGLFDDEGQLAKGWRMTSNASDTSDMLHARLFSYFLKDGYELADVSAAAVASVVPALTRAWWRCLGDLLGRSPLLVNATHDYGMPIDMPNPRTVGADRIANAVEARDAYGSPAIVVDFGTATNIDVVDGMGQYRGGSIAPGLMLSASALFAHAAKLAITPIEVPPAPIGDTTEHAIQSGLVLGVAAQAEGLVARIKTQLAEEAKGTEAKALALAAPVIATGGLSRIIGAATDVFDAVDMDLTLRGIWRIWLHHQG